jgi:XTP/dITP diphosphohydrolase
VRVARRFAEPKLLLASHNPGKLAELRDLLAGQSVEVISSATFGLAEPIEHGRSFAANAKIKAHAAAAATGLPALADDSGLVVAGLGGRPGVRSARWAGPERDFGGAMARVRDELAARYGSFAAADRRAAFVAALCLAWPDGHEELVHGRVAGELVDPPRGRGGFGYDPMFQPSGSSQTFAELPATTKQARSHRGQALRRLLGRCFGPPADKPLSVGPSGR